MMSAFLRGALYAIAVVFTLGAGGLSVLAALAWRDEDQPLSWLFAIYFAVAAAVICVLILAAGDLK